MGKKKKAEPPVGEILAGYAARLLQATFLVAEEAALAKVNDLLEEDEIQDIVDAALRQNLVVDIDQLINQTCELAAGRTALQYAAVRGHVNVSLRLIEAHANPNVACRYGFTALHLASQSGNDDVICALIESTADPNTRDHIGESPLHSAAQGGHAETTNLLLHAGAQLTVVNRDGRSALHAAIENARADVVELLVLSGADMNLKDRDGITPKALGLELSAKALKAPDHSAESETYGDRAQIDEMISKHSMTRQCQQNIRILQGQGRGRQYKTRQSPPTSQPPSPTDNPNWHTEVARVSSKTETFITNGTI